MSERLKELAERLTEPGSKCQHLSMSEMHELSEAVLELLEKPEIIDIKQVFAVIRSADGTEGRGPNYVMAVCEAESTARRMGKGKDVQGSDCGIVPTVAVRIGNQAYATPCSWLSPCRIYEPTAEDKIAERELQHQRTAEQRKQKALSRAKAAGLSDDDINALSGNG
ncbi:MAG: hypothetical protein JJT87_19360 [Halomonas sp.]|nr:hypothetical protein [Halomonas sp.]MCC5904075.1 hypothetical protein [Halomonas sp.]